MKRLLIWLAGITFAVAAAAAPAAPAAPARLTLWITDPIGATSGLQCNLHASPSAAPSLPTTQPTLTEHDVIGWSPVNALWTLSTTWSPSAHAGQRLQDRCFVLGIDGKLLSSGVVLFSHSARLTNLPTLRVFNRNNVLDMQLTLGNDSGHIRLIHVDALDAVLGKRAPAGAAF